LTWKSAGNDVFYEVFHDKHPGFTPSYFTMVADGLTLPSFLDDSVVGNTTYYYQVFAIQITRPSTSTLVGTASVTTPQ